MEKQIQESKRGERLMVDATSTDDEINKITADAITIAQKSNKRIRESMFQVGDLVLRQKPPYQKNDGGHMENI